MRTKGIKRIKGGVMFSRKILKAMRKKETHIEDSNVNELVDIIKSLREKYVCQYIDENIYSTSMGEAIRNKDKKTNTPCQFLLNYRNVLVKKLQNRKMKKKNDGDKPENSFIENFLLADISIVDESLKNCEEETKKLKKKIDRERGFKKYLHYFSSKNRQNIVEEELWEKFVSESKISQKSIFKNFCSRNEIRKVVINSNILNNPNNLQDKIKTIKLIYDMEKDPYEIDTSTHNYVIIKDILDKGESLYNHNTPTESVTPFVTESGIDQKNFSKETQLEEHVEPSAIEGSLLKESLREKLAKIANGTPAIDFSINSIIDEKFNRDPPSPDEFMERLKKNGANQAINNLDDSEYNKTKWESMESMGGGKKRTRRKNKIGMKL